MNPKLKVTAVVVACLCAALGVTYAVAQAKDRNSPPQCDNAKAKPSCPNQNTGPNPREERDTKEVFKCPHCGVTLALTVVGDNKSFRKMDRDDDRAPQMDRREDGRQMQPMGPQRGRQMDSDQDRDDDRAPQMDRREDGRQMQPMGPQRGRQMGNWQMPNFPSMSDTPMPPQQ